MREALQDSGIRKAIAVYVVAKKLDEGGRGSRRKCANALFHESESKLSQFCSGTTRNRIPTEDDIHEFARYLKIDEKQMVEKAIENDDTYHLLGQSKAVIDDFRKRYYLGSLRTHDSSEGHKMNLLAFVGGQGYKLFYLHRKGEQFDVEEMSVDPISNVEDGWHNKLSIQQDATGYRYTGTMISPPELYRTFIFIERKNEGGLYKDRGLVVLYFPQDKVRVQGIYQCGVGLMMSLDRNEKTNDVLFQRVVVVRKNHEINDPAKQCIWDILNTPMESGPLISIGDTERLHKQLYFHFHPKKDE